MSIDLITIIAGSATLLLAVLTPLLSPWFRRIRKTEDEGQDEACMLPPVTVIVTAHDNAPELSRHLPQLLAQDYPAGFQVVVVADEGDSDTDDLIKQLNDDRLYSTFVPATSRYMSRKKLAVTIGVKAARFDWIVLLDPECEPASKLWLQHMAQHFRGNTSFVMGYCNYDDEAKPYQRYEQLRTSLVMLRKARDFTPYRGCGCNIAMRKQDFLAEDGYRGSLEYVRGEYDYLVNKFAKKGETAIETAPEAHVVYEAPSHKQWTNAHLYYLSIRKGMLRSGRQMLRSFTDNAALHLSFVLSLAAIVFAVLTQRWLLCGIAGLSLVIGYSMRLVFTNRALKAMSLSVPLWRTPFYELSVAWHGLAYWLRYRHADKNDFTSHKQ